MSVGVIHTSQSADAAPYRHLKRSAAQSMVRNGYAIWVREGVIQLIGNQQKNQRNYQNPPAGREVKTESYIPSEMPRAEIVPGLKLTEYPKNPKATMYSRLATAYGKGFSEAPGRE